ncbi:MAG: DUF401 family protein [Thermodesulfovibrionaceae bacterium]
MSDIIKVSIIFLLILFLLRKRISVGLAVLIGSLCFFIFYKIDFNKTFEVLSKALFSHIFINLFLSLTLIKSFEYTLRHTGFMKKMTDASQVVFKNQKLSIISMPLIIGMLPSLGGAYLSAPMVDYATKNLKISKEEKAFINYWYRHPWELILPLYPGIVLASAVSGFPLRELILLNLPVAIVFFVVGFFLSMRNIERNEQVRIKFKEKIKMSLNFIPVLIVLLLVIAFKIDLSVALFLIIVSLCIYRRKSFRELISFLKYGFTLDVVMLVLGVIFFKEIIQLSGAVDGITKTLSEAQIPYIFVFIFIPFFTGFITGVSVGFVGSTFPLILHLKNILSYEISISFISGYIGVLLSPLHLCLILTKEYFKADIVGIYKKVVIGCLTIFLIALIQFIIFKYYS